MKTKILLIALCVLLQCTPAFAHCDEQCKTQPVTYYAYMPIVFSGNETLQWALETGETCPDRPARGATYRELAAWADEIAGLQIVTATITVPSSIMVIADVIATLNAIVDESTDAVPNDFLVVGIIVASMNLLFAILGMIRKIRQAVKWW